WLTATRREPRALALILLVTVVACLVDFLAGFEDAFRLLIYGGLQRNLSRIRHRLGHLHPIALIDRAIADEQQVGRLDQGRGIGAHASPFLVGPRLVLLDALGIDDRTDRVPD